MADIIKVPVVLLPTNERTFLRGNARFPGATSWIVDSDPTISEDRVFPLVGSPQPPDSIAVILGPPVEVAASSTTPLTAELRNPLTGGVIEEYDPANWTWAVVSGDATFGGVNGDELIAGTTPGLISITATHDATEIVGEGETTLAAAVTLTPDFFSLLSEVVAGQSYDLRARVLNFDGSVNTEYDPADWTFAVTVGGTFASITGANSDILSVNLGAEGNSITVQATYVGALSVSPTTDDQSANIVLQAQNNEPSGMTLIGSADGTVRESGGSAFGIASFNAWAESSGPGVIEVVPDATNPIGSGSSLRFEWAAGSPASFSGAGKARAPSLAGGPFREVYVRFQIFQEEGGWLGGHKYFYLRGNSTGSANMDRPGGGANVNLRWSDGGPDGALTDSKDPSLGGTGVNPFPLHLGQWMKIELHIRCSSTPDAPDGFVRMWVDGDLVAERLNAQFGKTHIDEMEWYARADTVPVVSVYRIGELYISGKN